MARKKYGKRNRYNGHGRSGRSAKQRQQILRAQSISARKRKGKGHGKKIAIATGVLAGVGATYAGYKLHSSAKANNTSISREMSVVGTRFKKNAVSGHARMVAAVQPGSKERTRIAMAVTSALAPRGGNGTGGKPTNGAASMTRTEVARMSDGQIQSLRDSEAQKEYLRQRPHLDPRAEAQQEKRNADPHGGVDKFLPGKELRYGKKVKRTTAEKAIATHVEAKSAITHDHTPGEAILNEMIAKGEAKARTPRKRTPAQKKAAAARRAKKGARATVAGTQTATPTNAIVAGTSPSPGVPGESFDSRMEKLVKATGMKYHKRISNWDILDEFNRKATANLYKKSGIGVDENGNLY